jgi:hypothetical protein
MKLISEFEEESGFEHEDFEAINWKLSPQIISSIRNHPHRYEWEYICYMRNLSEDFMIEFQDYITWSVISYRQKLSKKFIAMFVDKLRFDRIMINNQISQDVKDYCRMFL